MIYKRILVAVDGSETSDLALAEAARLAKALQSSFCILHVCETYPPYSAAFGIDFERYREIIKNDAVGVLDRAKEAAKQVGVEAEIKLVENDNQGIHISEKIIETVKAWKADLLIMGTHGRRGFSHIVLGSVAEEAARIATVPVLLVRLKK